MERLHSAIEWSLSSADSTFQGTVPKMYPLTAYLAILAIAAIIEINNLRIIKDLKESDPD